MVNFVRLDCETDGLDPTKVHCISLKTDELASPILLEPKEFIRWCEIMKPKSWVIHNGLGYDYWVINKLVKKGLINPLKVIDTFVVSRLVDFNKYNTHSLEELGKALGVHKDGYTGSWEVFTKEMGDYCVQDVEVLDAVWNHFKPVIFDKSWAKALRVEHDTALICRDMQTNGFYFDKPEAEYMLDSLTKEMTEIEKQMQEDFPPVLEEVKTIKYRTKKDGSLFSNVSEAKDAYPLTKVEGDNLICYNYTPFNPGSSKMRIDKLWEAGWKPIEMTKGYKKYLRENR